MSRYSILLASCGQCRTDLSSSQVADPLFDEICQPQRATESSGLFFQNRDLLNAILAAVRVMNERKKGWGPKITL